MSYPVEQNEKFAAYAHPDRLVSTEWLATAIREHLLKTLPEELKSAVSLPDSEMYQSVQNSVSKLNTQLSQLRISL